MRLLQCWAATFLCAPWRPLHAFLHPHPHPAFSAPTARNPKQTTVLHADAFVNFEGLQRKLNLTHFEDPEIENRPLPPNEDFASRPDIIKAHEIAKKLAPEFKADNYVTVCLYFHVFPRHLQSFREALQDFIEAQKAAEGEEGVYWEAFQHVALPVECKETRCALKQAGRVPPRCRVLLSGTFRDEQANDSAKRAVVVWRKSLLERLKGYGMVMDDPVETMPMSQAVYRRISPMGPVKPPGASVPLGHDSVFMLSVIQASWSSERKIRLHLEKVLEYREELLAMGGAVRAECAQDPEYPSGHRIWHRFDSTKDLLACMDGAYADLIEGGAKFRARVNHVEQAFRPILPPATSVLSVGLSTGHRLPLLGYGTSVFQGREREGSMRLRDALLLALQSGCRLIDCSPEYTQQQEVGSAIASALASGVTTRERLFVTASLHTDTVTAWLRSADPAALRADVSRTLSTLGLDYVDALLLPYPASWASDGKVSREQSSCLQSLWSAMEGLVSPQGQGGVARHLGVRDMPLEAVQLLDERPHTVPIDVCMVEMHPFYVDFDLVEYCQAQDDARLRLVATTPLGRTAPSRPPGNDVLKEPFITKTADALGCTPAQVVLRWLVQQGIAVVPNSLCAEHILDNVDLETIQLADLRVQALYEMSDIRQIRLGQSPTDKGARYSLSEVQGGKVMYLDDGQRVGQDYRYEMIDLDMVERMELGDGKGALRIEPRVINGPFPGMDVEPVEP